MIATETEINLSVLYEEAFPAVASFVAKHGGSVEDAKDIFHDAIIIFFEKEAKIDDVPAYVVGIAKHLWFKKFNRDKTDLIIEAPKEESAPIVSKLLRLLEQAGKNCLDLLQAFYYEKRSADSIAEEFHYSDAHSASVQKHKCLRKLQVFIKEKSIQYESFFE